MLWAGLILIGLGFLWLILVNRHRGKPELLKQSTVHLTWLAMLGFLIFTSAG